MRFLDFFRNNRKTSAATAKDRLQIIVAQERVTRNGPDYLPMMLEFVSQLEQTEARVFLTDAVKVFNVLAINLEKVQSPYAVLVRAIENHSSLARLAA